jgi:(1->4)-alpha-D-glucan 1-alpha-D-glucosylmutase
VDWALRRRLLDDLVAEIEATHDRAALAHGLLKSRDDGRIKLYVLRQALGFRREHAALFQRGDYRPLEARGPLAEHVCAFARVAGAAAAVTVVPRLLARRGVDDPPLGADYWSGTALVVPRDVGGRFHNVLTGERVEATPTGEGAVLALGELFASFPLALLEGGA